MMKPYHHFEEDDHDGDDGTCPTLSNHQWQQRSHRGDPACEQYMKKARPFTTSNLAIGAR